MRDACPATGRILARRGEIIGEQPILDGDWRSATSHCAGEWLKHCSYPLAERDFATRRDDVTEQGFLHD